MKMKRMSPILGIAFAVSIAFTASAAQAQNNQAAPAQNSISTTTQNGSPVAASATENKTASSNKTAHARVTAHYRHHRRYHSGYGANAYYRGNSSDANERKCMLSPGSPNFEPCMSRE
jgi:hypothetical protein